MKGLICGFLAATSAALLIILIKLLLIQTKINEFELIYQRSLIACLILCLILYINGISPFSIPKDVSRFAFQRVFGSFFGFMLEIFALDFIPSSKAVLIVNNPFLTSILSYFLIGEVSSKHDMISFLVCTLGVTLMCDPFNDSKPSSDTEYIGTILAVLSSISFNLSYLALRNLKGHQINSWILVFHIMIVNLMFMPTCFLSYDLVCRHSFTQYTQHVWLLLLPIGFLTLSTLYFTHLTFYYETAARGNAYSNFELIYTYIFDVFVLGANFRLQEMVGAGLILIANAYIYLMKTLGYIQ